MYRHECSAMVLAGGQGKRMGYHNKATLIMEGERFLDKLTNELIGFDELLLSTNTPFLVINTPYIPIKDIIPHSGPLGGIYSSLNACKNSTLFTVACDMPFFSGALADWILAQYLGEDILICQTPDGCKHPLCGIYTKTCLSVIEGVFALGNLKVSDILKSTNSRVINVPLSLANCFFNVNTLDDFNAINKI